MSDSHGPAIRWQKSSACVREGCLEIASAGDQVLLRRSEAPRAVLSVSRDDWEIFAAAVRRGEFQSLDEQE